MMIPSWLDPAFCLRLTQTLAHFLWQGAAIALAVALIALLLRRASASVRYGLAVAGMLAMFACPIVTFALLAPKVLPDAVDAEALAPAPAPMETTPAGVPAPSGTIDLPPSPPTQIQPKAPPAKPEAPWWLDWERYAPQAATVYGLGVLVFLARFLFALHGGQRLRRRSQPVEESEILAALARQAKALRLAFTPAIAYCRNVVCPTVVGVIRPTILLPMSILSGLTFEQVEVLLAHELAHIRRYDHLINVLQRLIEAFLFFHPAVWYVSRRIRIEREHCCDDLVVATGSRPTDYAASLVRLAELAYDAGNGRLRLVAALGANDHPSQLRHRISRLLDRSVRQRLRLTRLGFVISATAIVLLLVAVLHPASRRVWAKDTTLGDVPTSQLIRNLPSAKEKNLSSADHESATRIVSEVDRRWRAGQLSPAEKSEAINAFLALAEGPNRASADFDMIWPYLKRYYTAGDMDGRQKTALFRQMVRIDLEVRENLPQGDPVAFEWIYWYYRPSTGVENDLWVRFEDPKVSFDGKALDCPGFPRCIDQQAEARFAVPYAIRGISDYPKVHTLGLSARASLFRGPTGDAQTSTLMFQQDVMASSSVKVITAGAFSTVAAVRDPLLRDQLLDRIYVTWCHLDSQDGPHPPGYYLRVKWGYHPLPAPVACRAFVLIDGIEYKAGVCHGSGGGFAPVALCGPWGYESPSPKLVNVIFRSDRDVALESIGIHRYWEGELVFKDVPMVDSRILRRRREPSVGDPAPGLNVNTTDGVPLRLSDLRGKLVLLDFWATWCGPCVAETPNLKATWDQFGKDSRFAMIGLSFDESSVPSREYAKKNGLGWTQAFVKHGFESKIAGDYGVWGIPSIFLIGPDGKILAKNLRRERIVAEVKSALEKMSGSGSPANAPTSTPTTESGTAGNAVNDPPGDGRARNNTDQIRGVVRTPEGKPVSGAEVILCTPKSGAYIRSGRAQSYTNAPNTYADSEGRFILPSPNEPYALVVPHNSGYAEVTAEEFAMSGQLILKPWGRIEGVLRIGSKPAAGETVTLMHEPKFHNDPNAPRLHHVCQTKTDEEGRFVLEKLPPGEHRVAREIVEARFRDGGHRGGYTQMVPVDIEPGQTVRVELGGKGRPIVGWLTMPSGYSGPVDYTDGHRSLTPIRPDPKVPGLPDFKTNTPEANARRNAWYKTPAGKAYERQHKWYALEVAPDGSFRIDDIPAGRYELYVDLFDPPKTLRRGPEKTLAWVRQPIDVPEMPDGRNDEPLDVGTIELNLPKPTTAKASSEPAPKSDRADSARQNSASTGAISSQGSSFEGQPQFIEIPIEVKDAANSAPVPNALVMVQGESKVGAARTTNADGIARLNVAPNKSKSYSINVTLKGYVPLRQKVAEDQVAQGPVRFKLSKAEAYGGFVKNEKGEGIQGVSVYLLLPTEARPAGFENAYLWDYRVTTDADGKWTSEVMPPGVTDFWIRLSHPDYVSDNMYGMTPKPPIEQFRAGTAVMILKRGPRLAGRVTTADGKPIASANVLLGTDRFGTHYPEVKTNADGEFQFKSIATGQQVLTISHRDFAPQIVTVSLSAETKPLQITLTPGGTITGRVVDKGGKGLDDVRIVSDQWKGYRTVDIETRTNKDGQFVLKGCPADDVGFDVLKTGYMSLRRHLMRPRSEPYDVVLFAPLNVRGNVLDAETGQPISQFSVVPGIDWGNNSPVYWERRAAKKADNGHYEMKFSEPRAGHLIRIEADGYLPGISRAFKDDEGSQTYDFKLKKGSGPTGTVLAPDGKPLAGVEVFLCTPSQGPYIRNGRNERSSECAHSLTSTDGRFTFPPQTDRYAFVVLHDTGYAEVTAEQFGKSTEVRLMPWGRVEGTLRIGSKPGANEGIAVMTDVGKPYDPNAPRIFHDNRAQTDADGKFTFNRLPPGEARVARAVKVSERSTGYTHGLLVEIKPGRSAEVTIGGSGRPVIGRVAVQTDGAKKRDWVYGLCSASLNVPEPNIPGLEKDSNKSLEEKRAIYEAWRKSEAGKVHSRAGRWYSFKVEQDGRFRIDDVPAGSYKVRISVEEPPLPNQCGGGRQIGHAGRELKVPEIPGGRSDEPLDIGTIDLRFYKTVHTGDMATDFMVDGLDGKPLKLTDFRGKLVLLDFWATWCGPCVAETPNLKAAWDRFGKDPRFVMIGLSFDKSPAEPLDYAKRKEIGWIQAFVKDGFGSKIANDYGVRGIPAILLIGPDGKILAKDLRGERIVGEVKAALEKMGGAGSTGGAATSSPASQPGGAGSVR